MKKIKFAYLLLGLGVGIIITSSLHSLYPEIKYKELSDEMVIERAEELGYVSLTEKITIKKELEETEDNVKKIEDNNEGLEDNVEEKKEGKDKYKDKDIEESKVNEKEKEELIHIKIGKGDKLSEIAEKLYNVNLIDNVENFKYAVKNRDLEKKLVYGNYNFKTGMTHDEIIDLLIK